VPNLTKRLDLLAEARRDDPRVREHLIEAKAEIERLQTALLGIATIPREPPAAHFMATLLTPLCGLRNSEPLIRVCNCPAASR
jgi:hypothetical protein